MRRGISSAMRIAIINGRVTTPEEADVPAHTRKSFTIGSNPPGIYDYHVVIKAITEQLIGFDLRASANSDPRIIID